jgi:hypothetical protein
MWQMTFKGLQYSNIVEDKGYLPLGGSLELNINIFKVLPRGRSDDST